MNIKNLKSTRELLVWSRLRIRTEWNRKWRKPLNLIL